MWLNYIANVLFKVGDNSLFKYKVILKLLLISVGLLNISSSFASCSTDDMKTIRASALSVYKTKDYSAAEQRLSQYYNEECSFYSMTKESDEVLNNGLWLISDLMFYRNALDDHLGCLSLEDDVYWSWLISDRTRYKAKVEKALQTNITECRDALEKLYPAPTRCPVEGYEKMVAIPPSWPKQNELFYEVACIGFVENSQDLALQQSDMTKFISEGMNTIAKLDVLYVSQVKPINKDVINENNWERDYRLDPVYFSSENGELWGDRYCYGLDLKFGREAGMIFLEGGSNFCSGGSARNINRVIVTLDYPFRALIIDESIHSVK